MIGLLHGFAGDPSAWDDVPIDDDVRAVALPGHGSGRVARGWDPNLDAVADSLAGCDLVVGYSLGARVALGLVATGRCQRAVLISVNPGIAEIERPARRASDAALARVLREDGLTTFIDRWQSQPLFATQARVHPEKLAVRRARRLRHDPEQLARSLEEMGLAAMPDYRPEFPADRVGLIAGADDAKYVEILHQLGAPFATIPGSGHDPTLEQPAALGAAITRLIRLICADW